MAFSFVTAPFVFLTLNASFLVWARVYFYGVIGTALVTGFFASPAKAFVVKELKKRNEKAGVTAPAARPTGDLHRTASTESHKEPVLGLPAEPQMDFEEMVGEVRAEMEARQRRGIKRGETEPVLATKPM